MQAAPPPPQAADTPPNTRPRVGVVIPVYNRVHVIHEALQCVADQTRRPDHLVVVDDGSTDGSHEAVERFIQQHPALDTRLIRQDNAGVSAARNRAARELADCDLLAMLDSDDLWPSDYLERMTAPFQAADDPPVAAFCDQDFVDLETKQSRHRDLAIYNHDTTRRMYLYGPPTPSCTVLQQRAFAKAGGYRQDLPAAEDYALHLELSLLGRWQHVPGCTVTMRRSINHDNADAHHLTSVKTLAYTVKRNEMLEAFGRRHGRRISNKPWVWRRFVSRLWSDLAAAQHRAGETDRLASLHRRAWRCAPWRLDSAWAALACRFRHKSVGLDTPQPRPTLPGNAD